mmetsp:Transcript_20737/g.34243  ORF Transcript_20737/g.34243 Transcript_20737/m.34243 type:complete len:228 (+) Transcript_20737:1167-1850(+)
MQRVGDRKHVKCLILHLDVFFTSVIYSTRYPAIFPKLNFLLVQVLHFRYDEVPGHAFSRQHKVLLSAFRLQFCFDVLFHFAKFTINELTCNRSFLQKFNNTRTDCILQSTKSCRMNCSAKLDNTPCKRCNQVDTNNIPKHAQRRVPTLHKRGKQFQDGPILICKPPLIPIHGNKQRHVWQPVLPCPSRKRLPHFVSSNRPCEILVNFHLITKNKNSCGREPASSGTR